LHDLLLHVLHGLNEVCVGVMGVRRNFSRGGRSRHFAYLFQFVGEASAKQMDVYKICPMLFMATVTYNVFPI